MRTIYNFSAGPAMLPEEVLKKAQAEMLDYNGSGMSVMELSHRGKDFSSIMEDAKATLKKIMNIPDNYSILFLQGGASLQFAMVPMNLLKKSKKADYVNTGSWTKKAIKEAKKYGEVNVVASSEDKNFSFIPKLDPATFTKDADYFYIATNNTIYGTKYMEIPDTGDVPLVADMSSNFLSEEIDVSKFGIIFAGAQKNAGPSGVTIVIVRNDLVGTVLDGTPTLLEYKTHVENDSMYNTPPCYSIYICKLVFEWIESLGGIAAVQKINEDKAAMLYDAIDKSKLFNVPVAPDSRSIMNVPFVLPNEDLDKKFIAEAVQIGLVTLKGHRSVGGMRASIYNAMPVEGVKKLVEFIEKFEQSNS
ncbi:MAG: 3-phosphoserine/phosphohydroxythreonine transaminase [Candidatus Ancaeobacter aquaticus]|nr:3-phosphoserine/phosphohydroxythreonine transaminase [Candidatus Ancaeobacter aquaticus]